MLTLLLLFGLVWILLCGFLVEEPSLTFLLCFPLKQPKELKVMMKEIPTSRVVPLATDEIEETDPVDQAEDPVFQFSPEFHRVPSPVLSTPRVTFIPAPSEERQRLSPTPSQLP